MRSRAAHPARSRQGLGGFTLAEALLASVVLAVVAGAVTVPIVTGAQNAQQAEQVRYATEIGAALMDEILARPVVDSRVSDKTAGPSGIESSRKAYVNADAFNGYSETSDKVLRDYAGAAVSEATVQGFYRQASVQYVTFAGQVSGDTTGFLLARVDVYYQGALLVSFTRLIAAEG